MRADGEVPKIGRRGPECREASGARRRGGWGATVTEAKADSTPPSRRDQANRRRGPRAAPGIPARSPRKGEATGGTAADKDWSHPNSGGTRALLLVAAEERGKGVADHFEALLEVLLRDVERREEADHGVAGLAGEEAVETVIEATNGTDDRLIYEASDLIYHLIVLLTSKGHRIEELAAELVKRHKE